MNRYLVRKDGKTAYERCEGKRSRMLGIEFGEQVLWKTKVADCGPNQRKALGKLDTLWKEGVYLGVKATTGEIVIIRRCGRCVADKDVEAAAVGRAVGATSGDEGGGAAVEVPKGRWSGGRGGDRLQTGGGGAQSDGRGEEGDHEGGVQGGGAETFQVEQGRL